LPKLEREVFEGVTLAQVRHRLVIPEERSLLRLQPCLTSGAIKIAKIFLHLLDNLASQRRLCCGYLLLLQIGADLVPYFFEALKMGNLFVLDVDDVEAVDRLDQIAHLSGLHGKGGILEFLDRLPSDNPADFAAVLRARILRVLL